MKLRFLCFFFFLLVAATTMAQVKPPTVIADSSHQDSLVQDQVDPPETDSTDLPTDPPSVFSLVFTRGFMFVPNSFLDVQDTVPLTGSSSGTFYIGAGFRIPFGNNSLGMRLAPGYSWVKLDYLQTVGKTFPSRPDPEKVLTSESHHMQFIELPIGFYWNITKDEDNDPLIFLEAGAYGSYMIQAQYRTLYETSTRKILEKSRGLEKEGDFIRLKYGAYVRLGYKWAALYAGFRLSEVFNSQASNQWPAGYANPRVPPMELGFSLLW